MRFVGVLFGFDNDPACVVMISEHLQYGDVIDVAIAGHRENPGHNRVHEAQVLAARAFQHHQAGVLAMDVHDAADMPFQERHRIAAGKRRMPRIVEQADSGAGVAHQQVHLRVGFDNSAHVMVECHTHAEVGHPFGQSRELFAVGGPISGGEHRPFGNRLPDRAMAAERSIGIDGVRAAKVLQQLQMRRDRFHLSGYGLFGAAAVIPA